MIKIRGRERRQCRNRTNSRENGVCNNNNNNYNRIIITILRPSDRVFELIILSRTKQKNVFTPMLRARVGDKNTN